MFHGADMLVCLLGKSVCVCVWGCLVCLYSALVLYVFVGTTIKQRLFLSSWRVELHNITEQCGVNCGKP